MLFVDFFSQFTTLIYRDNATEVESCLDQLEVDCSGVENEMTQQVANLKGSFDQYCSGKVTLAQSIERQTLDHSEGLGFDSRRLCCEFYPWER